MPNRPSPCILLRSIMKYVIEAAGFAALLAPVVVLVFWRLRPEDQLGLVSS
jgi:hypothetical protein